MKNHTLKSLLIFKKDIFSIFQLVLCFISFYGCSNSYRITDSTEHTYITQGNPVFEDGGYQFSDVQGEKHFISLGEIEKMEKD